MGAFRFETDMVGPVRLWLEKRRLVVRQEFETPFGICDLLGCTLNEEHVYERSRLGQKSALGPPLRVHIWHGVPDRDHHRSASLETLHAKYEHILSKEEVLQELQHLVKRRFLRVTRTGTYQKVNGWHPLHKSVVAVELKLRRISEAILQASRYSAFSSESYVALPLELAKRIERDGRFAEFRNRRVGLLGVTTTRTEVVVTPENSHNDSSNPAMTHVVESFWRTHVKGNSSLAAEQGQMAFEHFRTRPR